MFVAIQNHKATHNVLFKSGKPLHSYGPLECICAQGRLESFPVQREVCHPIFVLI
jgi:hypothetical protein